DRGRAAGAVFVGRSDPSSAECGQVTALVLRSFGRVKMLTASLAVVLICLQLAIIAAARSLNDGNVFERLSQIAPPFFMHIMGPALTGFSGLVMFAYIDPLIVMLVVVLFVLSPIYLPTEPAGEIESNVVDLVLARPLPRHVVVSRSFLVMAIGTLIMSGSMQATTWAGVWWMAPADAQWPVPRPVVSLSVHMTLVAWCFGCIALAASGWGRPRGAVVRA